jgi:ABC-2 type transport system permease protein
MTNTEGKKNNFVGEIAPALWVEFQKVRRSKTLWLTFFVMLLLTLISGLFMFILKYPELAQRFGLVGAKAQLFGGTADWPSLFNLVLLLMTVGGLVIFGFIFVWIFGREFSDRTVYDWLALPTSRMAIVSAKITTAAYWSLALILIVFVLVLGVGAVLHLPLWSVATAANGLERMLVSGILTLLLCISFAFVASFTRSYLPAVGCIFLVLLFGQVFNALGYGQYFPWAIPALYSGSAGALSGQTSEPLGFISYLLVVLVGIISLLATGVWWRNADQS